MMFAIIDKLSMSLVCHTQDKAETEKVTNPHHVVLELGKPTAFDSLTALELRLLYRNLGSVAGTDLQRRDSVVEAIRKLLKHVPFSSLDRIPLFAGTESAESGPLRAATGHDRPAVKGVAQARSSGVRDKIWEVADRMWEEAGKPTDKRAVLALRKCMMDALERQDVKRTSSSNELGNWQKARIA